MMPPVAAENGAFMIGVAAAFLAAAAGLFFLELLVPSMGVITLLGVGCVTASLVAAFSAGRAVGVVFVAVVVVMVPVFVYAAVRMLRRTSLAFRPEDTPATDAGADKAAPPVGARGVAVTPLRPSGTALFGDRRVDVVTEGEMIEPGVQVEVVHVEGIRIVVRSVRV